MNDKNDQSRKTDWSLVDGVIKSMKSQAAQHSEGKPLSSAQLVPVETSVPSAPAVKLPENNASLGILGQWQAGAISKNAALVQLQEVCDAQLDVLKHQLEKAVEMINGRADLIAREYLSLLSAQQIENLTHFERTIKAKRGRAFLDMATDTATQVKEAQDSDWPDDLKKDTVRRLMEMHHGYVAQVYSGCKNSPDGGN